MIHLILSNPLFALGQVVTTPGAVEALETHNILPQALLQRTFRCCYCCLA